MKKSDWLTLFVLPALAVIILLFLLTSPLFLLPERVSPSSGHFRPAPDVKYMIGNGAKPIVSGEIAEIRALYAPDLFASSRGGSFPAPPAATNQSGPKDIIPPENPLFLACLPLSNETGGQRFAIAGQKIDNYETDAEFRFHAPGPGSPGAKKSAGHPKISIELQGGLRRFSIESGLFQDIALPAGRKPWSIRAEVRLNREGRVEHIFAEPTDCDPSLYQEILKKLYQRRLGNVNQACEGIILISYPAYFAANSADSADLSKRQNIDSK